MSLEDRKAAESGDADQGRRLVQAKRLLYLAASDGERTPPTLSNSIINRLRQKVDGIRGSFVRHGSFNKEGDGESTPLSVSRDAQSITPLTPIAAEDPIKIVKTADSTSGLFKISRQHQEDFPA